MNMVAWFGLALGVANLAVWALVAVAVVKLRAKVAPWLTMLGLGATAPADTRSNEELIEAFTSYGKSDG